MLYQLAVPKAGSTWLMEVEKSKRVPWEEGLRSTQGENKRTTKAEGCIPSSTAEITFI